MTNKYRATNEEDSTIILTQQRANYRLQAFKSELGEMPQNVVKFNFAERTQYGRVDENMNTVYPNSKHLSMLPSDEEVFFVMDFLTEPFKLLQNKMKQATRMRQIPNDPILSQMKPFRAYQNPQNLYLDFIEEYLLIFNSSVDKSKISNYGSWLNEFLQWTKQNGPQFPLTFSNFHRTKLSNIYTSGLAISIADLDSDKDPLKEDLFLNNKTLEFYLNAAKQFGFSVSKDVPWLLVADLNSPSLSLYLNNLDLSSVNEIFSQKYSLCYVKDVDLLRRTLERGFKDFITNNPYRKEFKLNKCNNININNIIYNNNINNIKYNNSFYNKLYITMRNIEEYSVYTSAELGRIQQKQEIFEKKLDKSEALGYTNEQFRKLVLRRPGGLYSIQQKQKHRSEEK
jgi:hypothetical protein